MSSSNREGEDTVEDLAFRQKLQELEKYTACDISDALLKLSPYTYDGFLADIHPLPSTPDPNPTHHHKKLIAPASTLLFTRKSHPSPDLPPGNIPTGPGIYYADLVPCRGKVVVIEQPQGQTNAVVGGIVAARLLARGGKGVVVDGRVRDLTTLNELSFPAWSRGTSTVGAGAASVAHAHSVPVTISGVTIRPGDIIFADPAARGVVCIPWVGLDEVLEVLPGSVAADEKVMDAVRGAGMGMGEAVARFRS